MNRKAVALFSGGLDSILAIKLMLEQGIEVFALNFLTVFCTCTSKGCMHQATKAARELNVPLKVINVTEEYMEIVKKPKYGRGRNMNPCVDCRIFTFRKARSFMEEIGASFVITGEVLGERPMSQRRASMEIIEKESGLKGLIVRPLSAKLFEPSMPEKEGIVDRNKLFDIQGRRRTQQISIARELSINEYPCPAGGCLLTDEGFSDRLKDLLKYDKEYNLHDLAILKTGRLFRISRDAKLFVGRDEEENKSLLGFLREGDFLFGAVGISGPVGLARGDLNKDGQIKLVSSIVARYSDGRPNKDVKISYKIVPSEESKSITVQPAEENILSSCRV